MNCCNNINSILTNAKFINAQLNGDTLINSNDLIPFDIIVANNGFTFVNGSFIVNKTGNYIIVYHLNIEGSATSTNIQTSILVNGNDYHDTKGNALVGQFSGSTAITLYKGDIVQLVNTTGEEIELTFANITIYGN